MRLSSGVATGLPSSPMNTPAISAHTPSSARAARSAGVIASNIVDSPGAQPPMATTAIVTDGTSANASAMSAWRRTAAASCASSRIIGA